MLIEFKDNTPTEKINEIVEYISKFKINFELNINNNIYMINIIDKLLDYQITYMKEKDYIYKIEKNISTINKYSREYKKEDSIFTINNKIKFGEGFFNIIAGPCCIESYDQLFSIASSIKKSGASLLRAGAFKPRTSPYSFQGLGKEGIDILIKVKDQLNIPIVSEILNISNIDMFSDVDIIQVGARNMQNFELLKVLGKSKKTILLKRGFCNTIKEFLLSAEYIMSYGNENIILCERGIRSFNNITRNTLDISCIPLVKNMAHLPIIVDPSHASGKSNLIKPLSLASIACGADGVMIEVHNNPKISISDSEQAISCNTFKEISNDIISLAKFYNKITF